jgi:hypothetical protein
MTQWVKKSLVGVCAVLLLSGGFCSLGAETDQTLVAEREKHFANGGKNEMNSSRPTRDLLSHPKKRKSFSACTIILSIRNTFSWEKLNGMFSTTTIQGTMQRS